LQRVTLYVLQYHLSTSIYIELINKRKLTFSGSCLPSVAENRKTNEKTVWFGRRRVPTCI